MARGTPLLSTPRLWTNQPIVLYHGTIDRHVSSILSGVALSAGRRDADFGRGFYTTTVERQARSWASELAKKQRGIPVVLRFAVDRDLLARLDMLLFVRGSYDAEDFWSLVFRCRSKGSNHGRKPFGWYDVVGGPASASWRQRICLHDVDQLSFHTDRAAKLLDNSDPMVLP